MDLYSVLDTVAKIGLGAAISGGVTYSVAKLNHDRELKKIGATRRIDLLEKISEQAEQYFYSWRKLASALGGIYNGRDAPEENFSDAQWKRIIERDKEFIAAREHEFQVLARLRLLGANEAANNLVELTKLLAEFRDPMILKRTMPTHKQFDTVRNDANKLIKLFHGSMSSIYGQF